MPTMNDKALLRHYLEVKGPEAAQWNLSPECLFLEFRMRAAVKSCLAKFDGMEVLNVGIGVGEWDAFLGYWIGSSGSLTSVDLDPSICRTFSYRQSREGHPNPSRVVCEDILNTRLPAEAFALVTVVGSTFDEVGDPPALFDGCMRLLKPGGKLFAAPIDRNGQSQKLLGLARAHSAPVLTNKRNTYGKLGLRIIVVEKTVSRACPFSPLRSRPVSKSNTCPRFGVHSSG